MDRQHFHISLLRKDEDIAVVRVAGQIDLCSSLTFREHVGRVISDGVSRVALDLSAVTAIDAAGLSVLAGVARRSVLEARDVVLVCSDGRMRRVLARTGLDHIVPVLPDVTSALRLGEAA